MKDYIEIKEENILLNGKTHKPWGEHRFIVYMSENNNRHRIRVNTDFYKISKGIYKCCIYYDRGLCNTIDEFRKLPIEVIENQAYGSWMDGAR